VKRPPDFPWLTDKLLRSIANMVQHLTNGIAVRESSRARGGGVGSYSSEPCGAWARTRGRSCQARGLGQGGRCKFHGGESTGPRTVEGRQRIADAQRARWARYRFKKRKS
jgi:hypothetical protein